MYHAGINHSTPSNLTYWWNFGLLALIMLISQIITGFFSACHYTANIDLAFISIERIMRDVNNGWLLRYIHSNGASMFFIVVYIHILRGMFFGSYQKPRQFVRVVGVTISLSMILTAFSGYVLPWGQMSFWAATVITNLVSAIPFIGKHIVLWLWGGYSSNNASLTRFYALHFLLPFIILVLVIVHILLLHQVGSNNVLGIVSTVDSVYSTPFYFVKDVYGILIFSIIYCLFVFFFPQLLGHPDNYIQANSMVTPVHIVPEWYLLVQYAISRSIPNKLLGVIALILSIIVLSLLPWIAVSCIRSAKFKPLSRILFWFFLIDVILLARLGANQVKYPYIQLGQILSIHYFSYFFIFLPITLKLEGFLSKSNY